MQIARSPSYTLLPVTQEPLRERAVAEMGTLPVQSSGQESQRATRSVEDIRAVEHMLDRQQAQHPDGLLTMEVRQQRAVATYQLMQQSDERAYVSEVLGIDVYA